MEIQTKPHHFADALNANNDTSTATSNSTEETEEKPANETILTEFMDKKAKKYKGNNPNFKQQYEMLEQSEALMKEQIQHLQQLISELKKTPLQRAIKVSTVSDIDVPTTQEDTLRYEHTGAKQYRDNETEKEIEILTQQLDELKSQHADIKQQMIQMVLDEMTRQRDKRYEV
ncbi:hypothetical protein CWB89_02825 [Pseudoalteromonas piscicida]|uniref:Uncharacterized protein n=1 Tax=Pseudoalteromonas piscicida TaxID=43662 RepID=A0AAQ2IRU6_PSEO7|nr:MULTISPECIES: hypothetical protein [Pseudoalteromonas]KJY87879.1 hypothetical protein TW75_13180 [Pseudoalteromonas piscicida]MDP4487917.1 hypothetical protein [Pseudoalteromonas piscicida]TMN44439.1 hypothetical protein CWB94_00775 [Pseudoalteromonas piscicida]TMN44922.1 hypothetical protein CWB95_02830 [Pseudoalteromonas piscicida]TMN51245.1 hypothetical protein CWB91_13305 [Pseudoalteromonas piscicida]